MVKYYTNELKDDGFGSQYQTVICSILYTELNQQNAEFVFTPMNLSTVYDQEANYLNDITNITQYYKSISDVSSVETITMKKCYQYVESNMDYCLKSSSIVKIRNIFLEDKPTTFDTDYINVAIHIRRPSQHPNIDLPAHHGGHDVKTIIVDYSGRFSSDDVYLSVINKIRTTYKHKPILFHLYSEGNPERFQKFNSPDIILHLNEPIKDTFRDLVTADVLVISKSSFSYAAALLNPNIIYYQPFWHKAASYWISF